MAVQMFALAGVVGDAVTGIEFKAAGDLHGYQRQLSSHDYSLNAATAFRSADNAAALSCLP